MACVSPARPGPAASEPRPRLDLTLPPDFGPGSDDSFRPPQPLLPPLFDTASKPGSLTLGGRLIPSEENHDFEFDLSSLMDQIDGAEIHIQILQ